MIASIASTDTESFSPIIEHHSKSFAMASRLLPEPTRGATAVLYAWCRRCDDAIDLAPDNSQESALARLEAELDQIYSGSALVDPVLAGFARVVRAFTIPRQYPHELLLGMQMDVDGTRYDSLDDLLLYCYRVAGVVGVMMCHVMGLRDATALRNAAHLGIAMQLTNICRDVHEDELVGRVYLPRDLLAENDTASAVRRVLAEADRYYASADAGIFALPWRAGLAVRAARFIYAAIGRALARRGYDVRSGRAVTSAFLKLWLVAWALVLGILEIPRRLASPFRPARLITVSFPRDVLPV